jgi:hypothetical protein
VVEIQIKDTVSGEQVGSILEKPVPMRKKEMRKKELTVKPKRVTTRLAKL